MQVCRLWRNLTEDKSIQTPAFIEFKEERRRFLEQERLKRIWNRRQRIFNTWILLFQNLVWDILLITATVSLSVLVPLRADKFILLKWKYFLLIGISVAGFILFRLLLALLALKIKNEDIKRGWFVFYYSYWYFK